MTDWRSCSVVRDRDGDLWGSAIAKGERWWANLGYFVSHTTDELEHHFGPIAPVLDANGLPVVTPAELAAAWDEGFDAMSDTLPGDYYPAAALEVRNPYRKAVL